MLGREEEFRPRALPGLLGLGLEPAGPGNVLLGLGQHQVHVGEPGCDGLDLIHLPQDRGRVCGQPQGQHRLADLLDGGCVRVRV